MIYPADLEEFSSIVEIEHSVQTHAYWYMQLKDQSIYHSYERFYTSNQTLFAFFRMSAIYTFLCIPAYIQLVGSFVYDDNGHSYYEIIDFIFFLTYFTGMILLYWMVYLHYNAIFQKHQGKTPKNCLRQMRYILKAAYFTSNLTMIYHLMARVASGQCRQSGWVNTWLCNPTADSHLLPLDVTSILMLMPLVYGVVVKGPDFYMIFGVWILNMLTFIVAMIYGDLGDSFGFVGIYFTASLVIHLETFRLNYFHFFTHLKLLEVWREKEKAADAANALEMRHMIANVAHDLKTVSTGVLLLSCLVVSHSMCVCLYH